jgi:hypothetical protein
MQNIVTEMINHTCALAPNRSGLFVGVCGPVSLGEQVRKAVGEIDPDCREVIGGIELCEEWVLSRLLLHNSSLIIISPYGRIFGW